MTTDQTTHSDANQEDKRQCNKCLKFCCIDDFSYRNSGVFSSEWKRCVTCLRAERSKALSKWQKKNPHKISGYVRKNKYGITPAEYAALLAAQLHLCAICEKPESESTTPGRRTKSLSVDHDHDTGKIRGLICTRCNLLLGYAKNSTTILKSAIAYMEYHEKQG